MEKHQKYNVHLIIYLFFICERTATFEYTTYEVHYFQVASPKKKRKRKKIRKGSTNPVGRGQDSGFESFCCIPTYDLGINDRVKKKKKKNQQKHVENGPRQQPLCLCIYIYIPVWRYSRHNNFIDSYYLFLLILALSHDYTRFYK